MLNCNRKALGAVLRFFLRSQKVFMAATGGDTHVLQFLLLLVAYRDGAPLSLRTALGLDLALV